MLNNKQILINGKAYDWASVTIMIGSQVLFGVTSISFSEKQNIKPIYNAGVYPIGYGLGKVQTNVKLTIDQDEYQILRASANEFKVQNIRPFDIYVIFFDEYDNLPLNFIIKNCKISNDSFNLTQNSSNSYVELDIIATHIKTIIENIPQIVHDKIGNFVSKIGSAYGKKLYNKFATKYKYTTL